MTNVYKGYDLFRDVEDPALRTWNRCAVMFNIHNDHGADMVEAYVNQFNDVEKAQMFAMYNYIQVKGYEAVKAEINKGEVGALEAPEGETVH